MSTIDFIERTRLGLESLTRGEEIWFPHPNGWWLVSNMGGKKRRFRILMQANGVERIFRSKRLLSCGRSVLETFVGPCPEGMECCHFPERDRSNNRLDNLRWDTHHENVLDAVRHGTHLSCNLTPEKVKIMIDRREAKMTPEQKAARAKRMSEVSKAASADMTPEERSDRSRKAAATIDRESLSTAMRKRWAVMTPEQRSEYGRRVNMAVPPEVRKARSAKMRAALTPEIMSERARKGNATRKARKLAEEAAKAQAKSLPGQGN